jgi:hypothetical protein
MWKARQYLGTSVVFIRRMAIPLLFTRSLQVLLCAYIRAAYICGNSCIDYKVRT